MRKHQAESWVKRIKIEADKGDDEAAHSEEDDLYENVLRAIATGEAEDPKVLAQIALRTKRMDFSRYCA